MGIKTAIEKDNNLRQKLDTLQFNRKLLITELVTPTLQLILFFLPSSNSLSFTIIFILSELFSVLIVINRLKFRKQGRLYFKKYRTYYLLATNILSLLLIPLLLIIWITHSQFLLKIFATFWAIIILLNIMSIGIQDNISNNVKAIEGFQLKRTELTELLDSHDISFHDKVFSNLLDTELTWSNLKQFWSIKNIALISVTRNRKKDWEAFLSSQDETTIEQLIFKLENRLKSHWKMSTIFSLFLKFLLWIITIILSVSVFAKTSINTEKSINIKAFTLVSSLFHVSPTVFGWILLLIAIFLMALYLQMFLIANDAKFTNKYIYAMVKKVQKSNSNTPTQILSTFHTNPHKHSHHK